MDVFRLLGWPKFILFYTTKKTFRSGMICKPEKEAEHIKSKPIYITDKMEQNKIGKIGKIGKIFLASIERKITSHCPLSSFKNHQIIFSFFITKISRVFFS